MTAASGVRTQRKFSLCQPTRHLVHLANEDNVGWLHIISCAKRVVTARPRETPSGHSRTYFSIGMSVIEKGHSTEEREPLEKEQWMGLKCSSIIACYLQCKTHKHEELTKEAGRRTFW